MNLCKDCRFSKINYPDDLIQNASAITLGERLICTLKLDGCTTAEYIPLPEQPCYNMRYSGPCGYDGRFWELRS